MIRKYSDTPKFIRIALSTGLDWYLVGERQWSHIFLQLSSQLIVLLQWPSSNASMSSTQWLLLLRAGHHQMQASTCFSKVPCHGLGRLPQWRLVLPVWSTRTLPCNLVSQKEGLDCSQQDTTTIHHNWWEELGNASNCQVFIFCWWWLRLKIRLKINLKSWKMNWDVEAYSEWGVIPAAPPLIGGNRLGSVNTFLCWKLWRKRGAVLSDWKAFLLYLIGKEWKKSTCQKIWGWELGRGATGKRAQFQPQLTGTMKKVEPVCTHTQTQGKDVLWIYVPALRLREKCEYMHQK